MNLRERLRAGEISEAQGDERGCLVLVEQERGRAARVGGDGRKLLRAVEVCDEELRLGEDFVDRAVGERDDVESSRRRGLDVCRDAEVATDDEALALGHVELVEVVGDFVCEA